MVDPRRNLVKAETLAARLPSDPSIKLLRRRCSCLQQKLRRTLELIKKRVASYDRVPIPGRYEKVFEEFRLLVQKVKTFVEDCCYEDENEFVLAAIRVIAHWERFFQYHVELDWCSFLVKCLSDADTVHRKPVYCQTLQKFDWGQCRSSLNSRETTNMITEDEGDLKARLHSWIAKPGEHQAICWSLLRRFGSKTESDLQIPPGNLGAPPIPTTLGKFIGSGAYGHVHEIKWMEKVFAVKVFQIGNAETINNEVKILERCFHPHIVNLILAHKEDGTQYLMMERLSWDLQSYMEERKKRKTFPIPILEVVDMVSQICEGMLYLNESDRKVSHRDLKPKNILVKELKPGTDLEIPAIELQVADFGVAKEGQGQSSISDNTPNCGTLRYRAPEMTSGERVKIRGSSKKADMYSFAVTCSFILNGKEPFGNFESTFSLKKALAAGERPPLPDNCPPALVSLLGRCWHSIPSERPASFYEILTELRKLKANLLTSAVEEVELPLPGAPEEPTVKFNPGDRRLNVLLLGDPSSVETVVRCICGANRRQTSVKDHVNLTESRNFSPPMCLVYRGDTGGSGNRDDFTDDVKAFVKARNDKWHHAKVEALWANEVYHPDPRVRSALFPDSSLRLHAMWFAYKKLVDLPNLLVWPDIMKSRCDLPVQILVTGTESTSPNDLDAEYERFLGHGKIRFPNAQNLEELIVKVAPSDGNLKENLWRSCWDLKTRAEIGNAAKIIREIRKELGSGGVSVQNGVGGAGITKEVSLSRSGEFCLTFLCFYWDIPQDSLRRVLSSTTNFNSQARGSRFRIERCKFVEFCLIAAAIILYNARDNEKNPKYVCNWNVSSESRLGQLLEEARACYESHFARPAAASLDYDKMVFEDIRLFLESIFKREDWDPHREAGVGRDSFISRIMKRISSR